MNRNVESHFAQIPQAGIRRSKFDRSFDHMTSFNVGELIPFYAEDVLPGDTFQVTTSKVVRLQTLLTPVFGNAYLDTYFFFVPNRLVHTHWREIMGENTASPWIPSVTYTVPTISAPSGGFASGTIADYLGWPVGVQWSASDPQAPIVYPLRAYALICNEYFRDENLTDPLNIPTGDSNQTGTNGGSYINDVANGGKPFLVAKYHDYFTSCLPAPQKGPSVSLNVTTGSVYAPVHAYSHKTHFSAGDSLYYEPNHTMSNIAFGQIDSNDTFQTISGDHSVTTDGPWMKAQSSTATAGSINLVPNNLWADLTNNLSSVTIAQLRMSFQLQRFYEKAARSGSRYIETIKAFFNVSSPDARLQRPEYLGGNRIPLRISEVTNSAQTATDFLGDLGAKSVTSDVHADFIKSFTEHGWIIGVMCVRTEKSYAQGLNKKYKRKEMMDYYWPTFANIGEQPVYQDEIYASAANMASPVVFGYQEAYADYRYHPNVVTGEMRPGIANTLASWNFADYYTAAPTLSDAWIREDKSVVDRTLAVQSANANQVFCDIYCQNYATRPMPMFSVPGLIDHN